MTAAPLPARLSLTGLRRAVGGCRACPLWRDATQAVFGEGLKRSRLMLVGEQPGDREDLEGEPFVGPSGRLLDRALIEAGIDRDDAYVTNTVKHFKFERRGKRRIHKRPAAEEIRACRPWLEAEIEVVRPEVLVALGATAAQSLLGRDFRITRDRGQLRETELSPLVGATAHPSSVLRERDDEARHAAYAALVRDLRRLAAPLR